MRHYLQEWTDSINIITEYNINFPLHLHKTVELVLVNEGQISLDLFGNSYTLNQGDIAIIFPGQLHSYITLSNTSTLRVIIFNPFILKDFSKQFEHHKPQVPFIKSLEIDNDIYLAFDRLYNKNYNSDTQIKLAWIQLITSLMMPKFTMIKNHDIGEYDLIYKIIDYLSSHYTEPITLDTLANELHVNKYYLSHTFSGKLNTSFTDYLNQLRTEHAMMLLSSTNDSITNICELSGFETQRTFNRVFKKNVGITPNKYRADKQP